MRCQALPITLAVFLSACTMTFSVHPLSPPEDAKVDEALVGVWRMEDEERQVFVHVDDASSGWLDMASIEHVDGRLEILRMKGFVTVDNDVRYLNVKLIDEGKEVDHYVIVRYRVPKDGRLELSLPDGDTMRELVEKGTVAGTFKSRDGGGGEIVLTGEAATVREDLRKHAKALFVETQGFVRMR